MRRLGLALSLLLAWRALAHPTLATMAFVEVSRDAGGGVVEVRVLHDVLAYALNDTSAAVLDWQMYELLEGPPEALEAALLDSRERFEGGFWLLADGERLECELVERPTLASVDRWRTENPEQRLPMAMHFVLRARLPEGVSELAVRGPHVLDEVLLVVRRPGEEEAYLTAGVAEVCEPFDVSMATVPVEPVVASEPVLEVAERDGGFGIMGVLGLSAAVAMAVGVAGLWWVRARSEPARV